MIQNLWDETKAILGGKYTTIQAYLKKKKKAQKQKKNPISSYT